MLNAAAPVALVVSLGAFQFGDRYAMNDMPFAKVKALMANPAKARGMAKQGNIEFLAGEAVNGTPLSTHGEFTDANCYLTNGNHAYDFAFCAKACVAAGSPVLFVADDAKVYVVVTARNAEPIEEQVLDDLGLPGVLVTGKTAHSHGVEILAIESVR